MTLFLVRHGQAEAGVEQADPGLDAMGRAQSEHTAKALAAIGAERLVVSPLRRARETAEPIARALDLVPELRTEVAEVFDPDMPTTERREFIEPLVRGRWSRQSEALRQWRNKALDAFVSLGATAGNVVVVSHFVAICAAIGEATGDDRVSPCPLANASITTFDVESDRLVLRRAGDISHLPREAVSVRAARPGVGPK